MGVPFVVSKKDETVQPGIPAPLFSTRIANDPYGRAAQEYAVSPDGKRFLMLVEEPTAPPINIILNWAAAVGARK
jgi:hypothetical protein